MVEGCSDIEISCEQYFRPVICLKSNVKFYDKGETYYHEDCVKYDENVEDEDEWGFHTVFELGID